MLDNLRQVESVRADISRLSARLAEVRESYFDRAYVERRVDALIDGWAERARDAFEHLGSRRGGPSASEISARLSSVELAALLQPKSLKDVMVTSARVGMGDAERNNELKRLETDIEFAEISEELTLRQIDAATGGHERRRLDANPGIILAPLAELETAAKPKAGSLLRKAS